MRSTVYFLLFVSVNAFAQLPDTDIWLIDIRWENDSLKLLNSVNIINRPGYDNQPAFSPDGKYILYTSIHDGKQSDIYKYDLKTKQVSQFTNTLTSEYSPTFMPDGKNISVVMVEPDSTQRLWKFSMKGGKPSVLLKEFDSIGYHCWFYGDRAAVFLLTEPNSLQLINKHYTQPRFVDDSIGRCFKYYNGMLYYTKKLKDDLNHFFFFNLPGWHTARTGASIESEDYIIVDHKVIYGKDNKLYLTSLYNNDKKLVADLSKLGITKISRIAISPDGTQLAIVAESKP